MKNWFSLHHLILGDFKIIPSYVCEVKTMNEMEKYDSQKESYYQYLKRITDGKELPLMGVNEDGEVVCVSVSQFTDEGAVFKVESLQKNDWLRINHYHQDGTVEETYKK